MFLQAGTPCKLRRCQLLWKQPSFIIQDRSMNNNNAIQYENRICSQMLRRVLPIPVITQFPEQHIRTKQIINKNKQARTLYANKDTEGGDDSTPSFSTSAAIGR